MITMKFPGRGLTETNDFGPWKARATYVAVGPQIENEGDPIVARTVWAGQSAVDAFADDADDPLRYSSSAGTIVSALREISIGGAAFAALVGNGPVLSAGQLLAIRVTVTDSDGNVARFPSEAGGATTVQALPVPVVATAPAITGGAVVGQTPTVIAATFEAIPAAPAGMQREIETRLTIAGAPVATPLPTGTQGQQLRAEARARHVLNDVPGQFSGWSESAPVTIAVVPAAITDLQAADGDAPGDLDWQFTIPSGNGQPITGYEYRLNGGAPLPLALNGSETATQLSGTIPGLAEATYAIEVRAFNDAVFGPWSNAAVASVVDAVAPLAPELASVQIDDNGGGQGRMTLTFADGEPLDEPIEVFIYIDTPADTDPDAETVAAGTGAQITGTVQSTVGATNVTIPLVGAATGTFDVFVAARYTFPVDGPLSNVVSDTGIAFDTGVAAGTLVFEPGDGFMRIVDFPPKPATPVFETGDGEMNITG
jgi:hypothetical protein